MRIYSATCNVKKLYAHKKISEDEFKAIESSLDSIYKVSHIELS